MLTPLQAQQQFDFADQIEAAVEKRQWKGVSPEKLWLIECEQGISLEIELNKFLKGLKLLGTPDATEDGLYQLELITEGKPCQDKARILRMLPLFQPTSEPDVIGQCFVENDQLWPVVSGMLDVMFGG